ncbi:MAG: ribonuclease J, partial [Parvibaculaceae bacterium]
AVVLRTPLGTVVHSGDWKIDRNPTIPPRMDEARLRTIGQEGVRALICDSTNVVRDGYSPSESEVEETLTEVVAKARRRVAITTFASHVGRVTSAVRAARKADREVVLAGRAMRTVVEAARSVGLLADAGQFLDEDAIGFLPPERVLLLCTGSQGEPRAAMARIAEDTHPNIALEKGDLAIFSSRTIPGNEKAVSAVMNALARRGIEILGSEDALVHTSGHPRRGELREMYEWLKPELVIPNHGEPRHLRLQEGFAKACGVPETLYVENGEMVRIAPGPAAIVDEAPAGTLHVDGRLIVPSTDGPVKFRRKLSFVGIAFVSLLLDGRGDVTDEPQLILDGLPTETDDGDSMPERLLDALDRALDSMPRARRREDEAVIETVRNALRREAEALWGKRPIVHVTIHRL